MSIPGDWDSLDVLAEPTRRQVFAAVRAHDGPVTRETVAADLGITSRLAAFHLDRLAAARLLDVDYARPPGRGGPGAGRPAKRYAPAAVTIDVTVPARRYSLVARILAAGVSDREDPVTASSRAAYDEGRRLGQVARADRAPTVAGLCDALAAAGYEPQPAPTFEHVRLRNCPFDDVVEVNPALICSLNHRFLGGVIDGIGATGCLAAPDGERPDCCVTIHAGDTDA